jgi:hypothetical protein
MDMFKRDINTTGTKIVNALDTYNPPFAYNNGFKLCLIG